MSTGPESESSVDAGLIPGPDGIPISAAEHVRLHRQAIFCTGGPLMSTAPSWSSWMQDTSWCTGLASTSKWRSV